MQTSFELVDASQSPRLRHNSLASSVGDVGTFSTTHQHHRQHQQRHDNNTNTINHCRRPSTLPPVGHAPNNNNNPHLLQRHRKKPDMTSSSSEGMADENGNTASKHATREKMAGNATRSLETTTDRVHYVLPPRPLQLLRLKAGKTAKKSQRHVVVCLLLILCSVSTITRNAQLWNWGRRCAGKNFSTQTIRIH